MKVYFSIAAIDGDLVLKTTIQVNYLKAVGKAFRVRFPLIACFGALMCYGNFVNYYFSLLINLFRLLIRLLLLSR